MSTIQLLIDQCQKERGRFQVTGNVLSSACVALFRHAFAGDSFAQSAIQVTFAPLIKYWIGVQSNLDPEDVMQVTWQRFYRYAATLPNLVATDHLGPLLDYLKKCCKTALLLETRKLRIRTEELADEVDTTHQPMNFTEQVALRMSIQQRLAELLTSEVERLVFDLRFGCGLMPQEIFEAHTDKFNNVKEVYNVVQRLTRRLYNDQELQELHGGSRQKSASSVSLFVSDIDVTADFSKKEEDFDVSIPCKFDEAILLDYITGQISAELRAEIEQSSACVYAARRLREAIFPLFPLLRRIRCPEAATLVAYQERELTGTEQLVVHHHISSCPLCQTELQLLNAVDQLPPIPKPGLIRRVVEALRQSPLTSAPEMREAVRGDLLRYETSQLVINLILREVTGRHRSWRLSGQLRTLDGQLFTTTGEVLLQESDQSEQFIQKVSLTETGSFSFEKLSSGKYELTVQTEAEEILIREITLGEVL